MKAEKQAPGVLSAILSEVQARVSALDARRPELEAAAALAPRAPGFAEALRGGDLRVIAEVKKRSPSAGAIRESSDAGSLAADYISGGAAAISVLTEPGYFGGSIDDLRRVAALGRPALMKDFVVDELQLLEARAAGAAAALLIVRALGERRLEELERFASRIGLETLIEVHNAEELEIAIDAGAGVIGVNARDLETLEMNPSTVSELLPRVPAAIVAVAESGIRSRDDVERVAAAGADAVLVGTHLAGSSDPASAVSALVGVRLGARAVRP